MNNFKCFLCQHEWFVGKYRCLLKHDSSYEYKSNTGSVLCCPVQACGSNKVVAIEKEFNGVPQLGKFSMQNTDGRKSILKDRSRKHNKTLKEENMYKQANNLF